MRKVLYILGELEDLDLQWLLDAGHPQSVSAGADIIREGAVLESLFIIVDGEFSVGKAGAEVARLGPGEVVGDMSLLDSRLPGATVAATQDSSVFVIPFRTLRRRLRSDAEFAARFYRALCIFLANRLNRAGVAPGRESPQSGGVQPLAEGEMSPDALDTLALAGARFDWFLQRVRGIQSGGM